MRSAVDAAHEALGLLAGDEFDNTIDEEGYR